VKSSLLALFVVVTGVDATACGPGCRTISTRALPLVCEPTATFTGELHFDNAATFETFLEQQCAPSLTSDSRTALVSSVDFAQEGVFVAVDANAQPGRCIQKRAAAETDVCTDGLRVAFDDVVTDSGSCPGRWTVAFALSRDDLRTALAAAP
jgi:hypothetical protein